MQTSQSDFDKLLSLVQDNPELLSTDQLIELQKALRQIDVLEQVEKAKTDFLTFVRLCGPSYLKFSSKGQHHEMAEKFERLVDGDLKRLTISMPPRFGKKIVHTVPVLTTSGWKTHGDLKVGDYVFGRNGQSVAVTGVSDESICDREVEFTDGSVIGCHAEHLWQVFDKSDGSKKRVIDSLTMESEGFHFTPPPTRGLFPRFFVDDRSVWNISKSSSPKLGKCIQVDGGIYLVGETFIPTHNSEFTSICLPAWFLGKFPDQKVMIASASDELATEFGRRIKDIIESPMFQRVFPGVSLSKDSKAAGKFATNKGGMFHALGITSHAAGKGADFFCADDLCSEQDARSGRPEAYDFAWNWLQTGPLQRIQPGGRIVMVATRWSKADPIGRVKRRMKEDPGKADQYESIEFSALDENGESNFPEIWPTKELVQKKNNMLPHMWAAQYDQNPTSVEGAIIKKDQWRRWDKFRRIPGTIDEVEFVPPECKFILMVLDTAYTENKRSNPTACTVWGLFDYKDPHDLRVVTPSLILLHAEKEKMEFGKLKQRAKDWNKMWKPDQILIEAKSSGPMLRAELREARIYTTPVAPKPNEDKMSRLNSVSDVFASGMVHYIPTNACLSVIEEVADFPSGAEDDYTDTVAYAVRHFRRGGMVSTRNDSRDEDIERMPINRAYY